MNPILPLRLLGLLGLLSLLLWPAITHAAEPVSAPALRELTNPAIAPVNPPVTATTTIPTTNTITKTVKPAPNQAEEEATDQPIANNNPAPPAQLDDSMPPVETPFRLRTSLTAQAQKELAEANYELALLLAVEALRIAPTAEATTETSMLLQQILRMPGRTLSVLGVYEAPVRDAAWSQSKNRILTASDDGVVRVWQLLTNSHRLTAEAFKPMGQPGIIWDAEWHREGHQILTANQDGTARIWHLSNGVHLVTLAGHLDAVTQAQWNQAENRILTASADGTAKLWHAATGETLLTLNAQAGVITQAEWRADEQRIFTVSADGSVRVWHAESGELLLTLPAKQQHVTHAQWNRQGNALLTAGADGTVRVWNAETGANWLTLRGHTGAVHQAIWNEDETRILTASEDRTARVWDAQTGEVVLTLAGHMAAVNQAAWSHDQSRLVTVSADGTGRVWHATTGAELLKLVGHFGPVTHLQWNMADSRLLTTSADGTARVWHVGQNDELATVVNLLEQPTLMTLACQLAPRNMTQAEWVRFMGSSTFSPTCPQLSATPYPDNNTSKMELAGYTIEKLAVTTPTLTAKTAITSYIDEKPAPIGLTSTATTTTASPALAGLVAQGRALAEAGQVEAAVIKFTTAVDLGYSLPHPPLDEARMLAAPTFIEQGRALAAAGQSEAALAKYEQALQLLETGAHRPEGEMLLPVTGAEGEPEMTLTALVTAYQEAQALGPAVDISAAGLNKLCWWGALSGQAAAVLPACEQAVTLLPQDGGVRDSRGLARAMTGDHAGAIADFEYFVTWATEHGYFPQSVPQRQAWLAALQAGQNPFDALLLATLRAAY